MYKVACTLAYAAFLLLALEAARSRARGNAGELDQPSPRHIPEPVQAPEVAAPEENTPEPDGLVTQRDLAMREFQDEDPFDIAAGIELGQIRIN